MWVFNYRFLQKSRSLRWSFHQFGGACSTYILSNSMKLLPVLLAIVLASPKRGEDDVTSASPTSNGVDDHGRNGRGKHDESNIATKTITPATQISFNAALKYDIVGAFLLGVAVFL